MIKMLQKIAAEFSFFFLKISKPVWPIAVHYGALTLNSD